MGFGIRRPEICTGNERFYRADKKAWAKPIQNVTLREFHMPDLSKIIDGKKFMWDGEVYESDNQAQEVKKKYEDDNFEAELIQEESQYLVYSRRVVTEIVLEGEAPA